MAGKKKPTYTPMPTVPQDIVQRYETVLGVLTGVVTKSEGATQIGMKRMPFQSLCHRAMGALIRALTPGKGGRPAMGQSRKEHRRRIHELEKQNARLSRKVQSLEERERALVLALRSHPRERSRPGGRSGTEDDEVASTRLEAACRMINDGMTLTIVAVVLMMGMSTLRRHLQRARDGVTLVMRRGPAPRVIEGEILRHEVTEHLEQTRGRAGAVVLSRITGGSRRDVAAIKKSYLVARERERKHRSLRVRLAAPGIVRSFDQLYVHINGIKRILLICADAFCSFRTTIAQVSHYDAINVARVIASDIRRWGAPLVWRFDRASSHLTSLVRDLLLGAGVLPLCGPSRYPQYYGQMERMNREHREWLALGPALTDSNIGYELAQMCTALNEVTIRPILEYRSAAAVWADRVPPDIDRRELFDDVYDVAMDRYAQLGCHGKNDELAAWRRGVESALTRRGLVTVGKGAWC